MGEMADMMIEYAIDEATNFGQYSRWDNPFYDDMARQFQRDMLGRHARQPSRRSMLRTYSQEEKKVYATEQSRRTTLDLMDALAEEDEGTTK